MEMLGPRRAVCETTKKLPDGGMRVVFNVPARGLLGFRSAFLTLTNGTGIMMQSFRGYDTSRGEIPGRRNGVMVACEAGPITDYAYTDLVERGTLFFGPGDMVYEGLVVGERPVENDMNVNIVRKKHITNHRRSCKDILEHITAPRRMNLDQALEYVAEDEWLEITPAAIRLRKRQMRK